MAKLSVQSKHPLGLKQVAIVTIAAVLLYKSQRVSCEESTASSGSTDSTTASPVCPDFCSLPPDSATRSKAPFPRWYFDAEEGTCKRFRWGGRGGNENRFFKRQDCENTCSSCVMNDNLVATGGTETSLKDKICTLAIDEGNCSEDQAEPKTPQVSWYFDQEQGQCLPFIFYGCGGNTNKFLTRADCEEVCF